MTGAKFFMIVSVLLVFGLSTRLIRQPSVTKSEGLDGFLFILALIYSFTGMCLIATP